MVTFYVKRKRRYIPISDERQWESWPHGFHLVYTPDDGGRSIKFHINAERAGLLAAIKEREEELRKEIDSCFKLRPTKQELTLTQIKAWRTFCKAMGNDIYAISCESVMGCIDRIIRILEKE